MKQEMTCLSASDVAWSEGVLSILVLNSDCCNQLAADQICQYRNEPEKIELSPFMSMNIHKLKDSYHSVLITPNCSIVAFLALSPAVSPELPLRSVEIEDPFGFTDAEETTVFSLILQSVEIEDPFGFTYAEETTVLSLILRSVEIEDLPVGSIAMNFREKIINFEGSIR
ncbi:hypothetical protein IGI04_024960 [Brassica rapa subsp. trilocularis]|uniref:Uncharacterized protein n=1 Tax=Brassica rapa subsp. trilocularis TaxID=1813537 RepID=A0ABQ7LCV5_BRACM|nr:hypothetical protein IGI04_035076 [Brassica rapa subsp. trilocularis]KAG5394997.1 hypothetical protein IGI04_024960 [Brassica rapa subsp. trilocularis]